MTLSVVIIVYLSLSLSLSYLGTNQKDSDLIDLDIKNLKRKTPCTMQQSLRTTPYGSLQLPQTSKHLMNESTKKYVYTGPSLTT
jgi:hypothetical protein